MQKMLVWCSLALAACGGGQKAEPAPPGSGGGPLTNKTPAETPPAQPKSDMELAMVAMVGFRDKLCACTDSPCATKVSDEMTAWGQEMAKKYNESPPKITEEQTKQLQEVGKQMGDCMVKAMSNNPPPNPGNNPCGSGP